MKNIPYKLIILIAAIIELLLLVFVEKKIANYGPFMFWFIALTLMMNTMIISRQLIEHLKTSNSEIYNKHLISLFGITRIDPLAFKDKEVINALDDENRMLLELKNNLRKYFILCFVLFGVFSFLL